MFKNSAIVSLLFLTEVCAFGSLKAAELTPKEKAQEIIKTNDNNKDGKLSKDEVDTVFRLKRFRKVDLNGDGLLDEAELAESYSNSEKAQQQRQAQGEPKSPIKQLIETVVPTPSSTVKTLKDSGQRYKVEPGDSVYRIAKKYNVSEEDLVKINKLEDVSKLGINQVLIIPASN